MFPFVFHSRETPLFCSQYTLSSRVNAIEAFFQNLQRCRHGQLNLRSFDECKLLWTGMDRMNSRTDKNRANNGLFSSDVAISRNPQHPCNPNSRFSAEILLRFTNTRPRFKTLTPDEINPFFDSLTFCVSTRSISRSRSDLHKIGANQYCQNQP